MKYQLENLLKNKINNWEIIGYSNLYANDRTRLWEVKCKCGLIYHKRIFDLKRLKNGCFQCACKKRRKPIDMAFGDFEIISSFEDPLKGVSYKVKCKCGNIRIKLARDLCIKRNIRCSECAKKNNGMTTHGMSGTHIFRRWQGIKDRCNNNNNPRYDSYGGRGIKICQEWLKFENFFKDMGDIPFLGAQLDRIDPDGDYEPSNCRWVTPQENCNNRRVSLRNKHLYITIHKDKLKKLILESVHKIMNGESMPLF